MKLLVVLAFAWCCSAQMIVPYPAAQQYHAQDAFGQSTFGYYGYNQNHHQTRRPDGSVVGHYSYIDPEGKPVVTFYEAGANTGYRVKSNNLPEAVSAELSPPVDTNVAPEPVQYTAEVAEAREAFQKLYDAAAARPSTPEEATPTRRKRQAVFFTYPVTSPKDAPTLKTVTGQDFPTAVHISKTPQFVYTYPFNPLTPYTIPFNYHGFPFLKVPLMPHSEVTPAAEEGNAVEEVRRRRRSTPQVPQVVSFPFVHHITTNKYTTQQFEPAEADTPADTDKIVLTTKDYEYPAYGYVSPLTYVRPVTPEATEGQPITYTIPFTQNFAHYTHGYPFYSPFPFVPATPAQTPTAGVTEA